MCHYPLFETLLIMDGEIQNLHQHQERINNAMFHYFKTNQAVSFLSKFTIPLKYQIGQYRCRIDYNAMDFKVYFSDYAPRKLSSFQCVETKNLDYQFKYTNREIFEKLKRSNTDEVIIINNGFVSDCTIGNLIFLKQGQWYSSKNYLLKGTQLSYLIKKQKVKLIEITQKALFNFEKIMMINALNPFNEEKAIIISDKTIIK